MIESMSISVDYAVTCAHGAIMSNLGQNCCAGSRTFVEASIYDKFLEKSIELCKNVSVGDPFDPLSQQGALVKLTMRYSLFQKGQFSINVLIFHR